MFKKVKLCYWQKPPDSLRSSESWLAFFCLCQHLNLNPRQPPHSYLLVYSQYSQYTIAIIPITITTTAIIVPPHTTAFATKATASTTDHSYYCYWLLLSALLTITATSACSTSTPAMTATTNTPPYCYDHYDCCQYHIPPPSITHMIATNSEQWQTADIDYLITIVTTTTTATSTSYHNNCYHKNHNHNHSCVATGYNVL